MKYKYEINFPGVCFKYLLLLVILCQCQGNHIFNAKVPDLTGKVAYIKKNEINIIHLDQPETWSQPEIISLFILPEDYFITRIKWLPDGKTLIVYKYDASSVAHLPPDEEVHYTGLESLDVIHKIIMNWPDIPDEVFPGDYLPLFNLAEVSPDGKYIGFLSKSKSDEKGKFRLGFYDYSKKKIIIPNTEAAYINNFSWSSDSKSIVYNEESKILIYDVVSDTVTCLSSLGHKPIYHPDGRVFFEGKEDGYLRAQKIFDKESQVVIKKSVEKRLLGHPVCFSKDGRYLFYICSDPHFWNMLVYTNCLYVLDLETEIRFLINPDIGYIGGAGYRIGRSLPTITYK